MNIGVHQLTNTEQKLRSSNNKQSKMPIDFQLRNDDDKQKRSRLKIEEEPRFGRWIFSLAKVGFLDNDVSVEMMGLGGGILFLLISLVLSFLAPTIINSHHHLHINDHHHHRDYNISSSESLFHVPKSGGGNSTSIWSSRLSNLYYGCSNASRHFLGIPFMFAKSLLLSIL